MLTPAQKTRLETLRNPICYYNVNGRKCLSLPFGTVLLGKGEGKDKGKIYCDSVEQFGTLVSSSENGFGREGNRGYYADSFQHSVVRFGVVRINTAKGKLYVAVTWETECDGVTLHFNSSELIEKRAKGELHYGYYANDALHEDAIRDVMIYADSCARYEADNLMEANAKDQAEQLIESLKEEIENNKEQIRAIRAELHKNREINAPTLCGVVRTSVKNLIGKTREARERIEKLEDNFWYAVEGY